MFVPVRQTPEAIEVENCPSSLRHSIATCSNPNPIKKYMCPTMLLREINFYHLTDKVFTCEMKVSIHA